MSAQEPIIVPALNRALDILEYVGAANQPVSIKEISGALGIPSASCFRSVKNLQARGYLLEDRNISGLYSLGFKILSLSDQLQQKLDLRSLAINAMRKAAVETNHAVQLAVLEGANVVHIEQMLPFIPVKTVAPLRTAIPVNVSAAGKILYANLPYHIRAVYLHDVKFERYTDNSITDKTSFERELLTIEQSGIAYDNEEFSIGIGCLAVPIRNHTRQCVAALVATGSIRDYKDADKTAQLKTVLQDAAQEISTNLGFGS